MLSVSKAKTTTLAIKIGCPSFEETMYNYTNLSTEYMLLALKWQGMYKLKFKKKFIQSISSESNQS